MAVDRRNWKRQLEQQEAEAKNGRRRAMLRKTRVHSAMILRKAKMKKEKMLGKMRVTRRRFFILGRSTGVSGI